MDKMNTILKFMAEDHDRLDKIFEKMEELPSDKFNHCCGGH